MNLSFRFLCHANVVLAIVFLITGSGFTQDTSNSNRATTNVLSSEYDLNPTKRYTVLYLQHRGSGFPQPEGGENVDRFKIN